MSVAGMFFRDAPGDSVQEVLLIPADGLFTAADICFKKKKNNNNLPSRVCVCVCVCKLKV